MAKSKPNSPPVKSLEELIDFFDAHDMSDYWERMPEAEFEVSITSRKHLVALDEDVAAKVTEIARARKISSETLINDRLKEEIRKAS